MLGFEPQIPGIGSDRSTNWATTTAPNHHDLFYNTLELDRDVVVSGLATHRRQPVRDEEDDRAGAAGRRVVDGERVAAQVRLAGQSPELFLTIDLESLDKMNKLDHYSINFTKTCDYQFKLLLRFSLIEFAPTFCLKILTNLDLIL